MPDLPYNTSGLQKSYFVISMISLELLKKNLIVGMVVLDEAIHGTKRLILYIHTTSFLRINVFLRFFFPPILATLHNVAASIDLQRASECFSLKKINDYHLYS